MVWFSWNLHICFNVINIMRVIDLETIQSFVREKYSFNPFPNKPWFLRVCSTSLLKTLWEKKKLLVGSNFSFSHSVLYQFEEFSTIFIKFKIVICKLFQLWRFWCLSFGKGLKLKVHVYTSCLCDKVYIQIKFFWNLFRVPALSKNRNPRKMKKIKQSLPVWQFWLSRAFSVVSYSA